MTELTFSITNSGTGTLTWTISESIDWLTLDVTSDSTTTETDQITVTAARGGLAPGDYNSNITITSDGGNQGITVSMEVSEVPTLSVIPTSLDFGTTTTQKSFEITNSGTGTLTWIISESISWLTLDISSGSTSTEKDQISVTVNRSGLDPNSYNGAISITSDGGNQDVIVTMEVPSEKATVTTINPSNISCTETTLGGNVTDDGGATVTERGIVYSTSQYPTTSNNKIVVGAGTGIFSTVITGLELNTTYHVRAYAINNAGTSYGNDLTFTTPNIPSATTLAASNITNNSVTLNGQVNANGSPTTVTFKCADQFLPYQTYTATPSTVTGTNTVNVSVNITGLSPGNTYNFFVVAENCAGTTSGDRMSFTPVGYPTNGLISYFNFDNNLNDVYGNTPTGTINGTLPLYFLAGKSGNAVYLNGTNQYVEFNRDSYKNGNNVSVALWLKKPNTSESLKYFITCSDFGVDTNLGNAGFVISLPSTNNASGSIPENTWVHLVGTYDGVNIKIYINGALKENKYHPGDISDSNRNLTLGYFGSTYWNGYIDDLFIYNKTLTETEVTQLYNYH